MGIHDYNNPQHFPEHNACLLVDVYCYGCKKLCAMSNTKELDGRRYCSVCYAKNVVDTNVGGMYLPELDIHWEDTV